MLNAAVQRKRIRSNPVMLAKAGKTTKRKPTVWSAADLSAFLQGVRGHRLEALWWVLSPPGAGVARL